jgi:phenylpropionate dioxygenase-like ring-hydroxylating dioxygenase large terminal subunit
MAEETMTGESNSEAPIFLRNRWYVAALSSEIREGITAQPLARTIANQLIVFYRDTRGTVIALEDRCAHRQAPLSLGEVVGDHIQCGYHGFTFDGSGRCVLVPSQDSIPPGTCVRAYPIVEKQGFVHVWTGDADRIDGQEPYDFPYPDQDGLNARYASLRGAFDYRLLVDNLMDLSHLSFTHKNTIGSGGVASDGKTRTERDDGHVRVIRQMEDIAPAPAHVEVTGYSGNVDRWQIIEFSPPCHIELQVGNAKVGTGGLNAAPGDKLIDRRTMHIATPETNTTTHYFWVSTYPSDSMTPEQEQTIYDRTMEVLGEDIRMIEGQQSRLDPKRSFVDINEDAGQIHTRNLLTRLIAEEQNF